MFTYAIFLGVHPHLSRAEILAALHWHGFQYSELNFSDKMLTIELEEEIPDHFIDLLGGIDRIAVLYSGDFSFKSVGISALDRDLNWISQKARELKQLASAEGRKFRFITPQQGSRLNAAAVEYNKLTHKDNAELTFDGDQVWRTIQVQDVAAYTIRDTDRPGRDAKVGMLPPKLAQIMLNLAAGTIPYQEKLRVWDPFCGAGTILQEGWLRDWKMTGSDQEARMLSLSKKNMRWLAQKFDLEAVEPLLIEHDARLPLKKRFDLIVSEPYLGPPAKTLPTLDIVQKRMNELGKLYIRVLKAVRGSLTAEGAVMLALPAWRVKAENDWFLLPNGFLDAVEALGYSRVEVVSPEREKALYARPDARVARELVVWKKQ